MKRATLNDLLAGRAAKQPLALVSALASGEQWLVGDHLADATPAAPDSLQALAREALIADRSGVREDPSHGKVFVQCFQPPLRLAVVGAVHIAQALAPVATWTGYEVTVIDPRRAWTGADRFAGTSVREDWPDDALTALHPDTRTAVVTLSHDPKLDDPALQVALRTPVFYIGSLGSKKTHAARLERLREAGFDDQELSRIHGPIGLPIGAKSPAEIALAIMAEVTQTLRQARP